MQLHIIAFITARINLHLIISSYKIKYIVQQTGGENRQTYQPEGVILI